MSQISSNGKDIADTTYGALRVLMRLLRHLKPRRRFQFVQLMALMIASAFLEMVSLGAIIPFLGVLAAPDRILELPLAASIAQWFGLSRAQELLLPLAVMFGASAVASAAVRVILVWGNTRLNYAIGADLSIECYRRTLYQPYSVHLVRNSSVVISTIATKIGTAVSVLYQMTSLLSSAILSCAVVAALIIINPLIAICAGGVLAALYLLIIRRFKLVLLTNSTWSAHQEDNAIKILQEGVGGIRDVLLEGAQEAYASKYAGVLRPLRSVQATNLFIAVSPRYVMEAIGMVIIVVIAYVLSVQRDGTTFFMALPILGAFALGAQRLLPTMQQVYAAWASVLGNQGAVIDVVAMLDQHAANVPMRTSNAPEPKSMTLERGISIQELRFRYSPDSPWVLNGFNLKLPKGARIGLVGATGSGKSTVVDILIGLLQPTAGVVRVDDTQIGPTNVRDWQRCVAHVPQSIFLLDAPIIENIGFGLSRSQIDLARIRAATKQAQLMDFIESLPLQYECMVGERGVRLSGGQRQRIGIARALYKDSKLLVLDEATSALDNETEALVMETIEKLDRSLTIVMVAHRLTSLRNCDRIIEIVDGKSFEFDSFDALMASRKLQAQLPESR